MKKENLTITDIAKASGVSRSTVSRVLNNSEAVNPITRKTVEGVIKKNNYSPSVVARNLSKSTSNTVGVIVPEVDNPFFGEVLRGITEIVDKNDLTLICCNTDDSRKKDIKALEMLKNHRVCGLIYTPAIDYEERGERKHLINLLKEINTAVVLVDRVIEGMNLDGVFFDDNAAIYNAVNAFIERGHTKIAIINATLDRVLARIRHSGYIKALKESGICPEERYMFFGDYSMKSSYELSVKLLSMQDRPTAVITCNNTISLGFLKALYERSESIPDDISLVGLDKIEALDIISVPFNYIERDARKMGRNAMEMLIGKMAFPRRQTTKMMLEAPLVIKKL